MSNFPHLSSILNDHLENDNNQSSLLKESKVFKNEIRSSYEEMHEKNTHSEMPTEAEENECTNAASLSLSSPEIKHEGKMPNFPFNAEFNRVNDPLLSKDSEVFEDEKQSSNDSEMHENNTSSCHIGLEAKKSHQDEKKECTDDSMHCLSSPERVLERKILQIRIRKIDSFEPEEVSMLLISNNDKQTGRCEEKQDVCIRQSSMVCSDQNVGKEHEREIHECRVCKKQCQSKFYLSVHLITHMDDVMVGKNDSRKFKCDLCAEKFVTNSLLQEHIICTHTEQRPLLCGFCSKTFASKNDFVEHSRSHVIPKPFRCHICPRGFRGKQILLAHINSHTGEKPFVCDICPKRYPHKKGLLCHKKYKHSSSRPFVCHICGKGYPLIGGLNEHVKIHNKDKPYVCEICGKQFTIIQQLTSHTNQHTEERPYKCQECESSFKFRHHLVSHMKTHATEKEFACDICNRSFTRAFGLKIHKLRHSDIKSLCCDMCDKVFSSYSGLYVHKSHHTGKKPHECDVCGKTFYQKQALQIHLRVHTGEKPYSCNLCNKTFTRPFGRDKHMRVHKGEKPHVCDICGHRCIEKHNLRAHIKRVHQMSD